MDTATIEAAIAGDRSALAAAGAAPRARTASAPAAVVPAVAPTGIKAVDLWCPLPTRGLVQVTPGLGVGCVVLLAELSYRAIAAGRPVVWTGFVPAPTDLGDFHHAVADAGVATDVVVSMAPPTDPEDVQLATFERGIRLAADAALLVVFTESGHLHAVEERLLALAARGAATLVVAPLDGTVAPPAPTGSPYLASIAFDIERARHQLWPAISAGSWSKVADPGLADLAARARAHRRDELDRYLTQPFHVAEHVMGQRGVSVSLDDLRADLAALLAAGD